jgi:hypothetical protein
MSFGKRQPGAGAGAPAFNAGTAGVQGAAIAESDGVAGHPIRWFIAVLACGAMLYGLVASYGPDIVRDHRLAGTWQPAYDLRASDGKCERTNFIITFCTAKIRSVAVPDQTPVDNRFMMLFSGGGGEALTPVRSTKDRAAVSTFYSAETKLWNRTLSFLTAAVMLGLFSLIGVACFCRAVNS